ncbi:MAG TPA: metallophosphoesterase [Candidatus Acidoferrales bacterium]|nr:metallophosphoesterase [Candidatus Acidoferrales bacterium]
MKILIFSDIHGDLRALERIVSQPADLYIDAGDLATFGRGLDRCGEVLKPLGEKLWVLPGNHESHETTRTLCQQLGFVDFHRQVRTVESAAGPVHWAGLGYSNVTPFNTPGEYTEEELARALAAFDGMKPLYLVVHCPPLNTKLDEYAPGKHAGSPAVREWAERNQPVYLFCGHIHETANMRDSLGATQCINVGKQGYTIEI